MPLSRFFRQGLDPACGELQRDRAERKRKQVESLAAYALAMMGPGTKAPAAFSIEFL